MLSAADRSPTDFSKHDAPSHLVYNSTTLEEWRIGILDWEVSNPLAMMLAIPLPAGPNWVLFSVLDRIYRRFHPAAYELSWGVVNDRGPSRTMPQVLITRSTRPHRL